MATKALSRAASGDPVGALKTSYSLPVIGSYSLWILLVGGFVAWKVLL